MSDVHVREYRRSPIPGTVVCTLCFALVAEERFSMSGHTGWHERTTQAINQKIDRIRDEQITQKPMPSCAKCGAGFPAGTVHHCTSAARLTPAHNDAWRQAEREGR